jgi:rifampicin phosphotransferase
MIAGRHFTLDLADAEDIQLVGGKAANLGRLIRAGFRVPPGFVIGTQAFLAAASFSSNGEAAGSSILCAQSNGAATNGFHSGDGLPKNLVEEICAVYKELGGGPVAVRSSATAEDLADASMAGQYETILDVEGEAELVDAVQRCWAGFDTPRTHAYFREHGIDPANVAMAVVVQRLVHAQTAGVLFTANPQPGRAKEMLIEASHGLGEALVSGRVQPDVFRINRDGGKAISSAHREHACLSSSEIRQLWQLGTEVAAQFGAPQDIEWAIHDGEIFVLQSRPITTLGNAQAFEDLLHSTRQHLHDQLAAARGPWVLHNLAETLQHPTPLGWSVVRQFMSGSGAMGTAYRRVGFEPSPMVCREGFLELIAGRVYMDAARAPEMFFENFPFGYDLANLKSRPDAGQLPPTVPCGTFRARLRAAKRLAQISAKLQELTSDFDRQLVELHFPRLQCYVNAARDVDLTQLSNDQLIDAWQQHRRVVVEDFGAESIVASLLAGHALDELRTFLQDYFWQYDPQTVAEQLAAGGAPNRTLLADAELYEVGVGSRPLDAWLHSHGHRGPNEFDLSAPRWREQSPNVQKLAETIARGEEPLSRHTRIVEASNRLAEELKAKLSSRRRDQLDQKITQASRYITFREDAKDFLMLGYELLRGIAMEIGRRLGLGDDVFFLQDDELLSALGSQNVPQSKIDERKRIRRAEKQISLPHFIDGDAIEILGDAQELKLPPGGLSALPLSAGMARGPAKILHSPVDVENLPPGCILVCPSTDPSWTPLFAGAAGLVLECGGTLSHGAVVAREMGLPAVVLPGATQLFVDGENVRLDANRGWVARADEVRKAVDIDCSDPNDTRIPAELIPPLPGQKDRAAREARNLCAAVWTVFLIGFFLLPESWIRQLTFAAIDAVLWPLVRSAGKPATVAIVAVVLAILALLVQKFITDNARLREAKRRAGLLQRQAKKLPANSPRRRILGRLISTVQTSALSASLVPIGILLGPMALPFVWFSERIDPTVASSPPGSAVHVVAQVKSDWPHAVQLSVPEDIALDETTPAARTLPPIRKTLERLLALLEQPANDASQPWESQAVATASRQQVAADLKAYLAAGIPPQGVTWVLRPPRNFTGKFAVALKAKNAAPIAAGVVLGDEYPPAPTIVTGSAESPLVQLQIVYPKPKVAQAFWQPFSKLADDAMTSASDGNSIARRLAAIDVSWLWLYLIVYIPVLFVARKLLRVA